MKQNGSEKNRENSAFIKDSFFMYDVTVVYIRETMHGLDYTHTSFSIEIDSIIHEHFPAASRSNVASFIRII